MSDRDISPQEAYGSRSRSRSQSREDRRSRSRERQSRRDRKDRRSRSRSLLSGRKRHSGDRERPHPSKCIGVFGLSIATSERELRDFFSKYGRVHDVQVVYDAQTGRSRGFAFVYYEAEESATEAKEQANGLEIDGRKIRVDFSITKRAHTPTPGVYMGRPTRRTNTKRRDYNDRYNGGGGGGYNDRRGGGGGRRYTRSPSPYRERRGGGGGRDRYRERDRSYSPRRSYY